MDLGFDDPDLSRFQSTVRDAQVVFQRAKAVADLVSIGPNAQETGYLGALRWMIGLRLKMTSLRYGPEQIGPS